MAAIKLVFDAASLSSPGGERLLAELTAALDRTCPADATALVLRRADQEAIGGFTRIDERVLESPLSTRLQKWSWMRRGLVGWVRHTGANAAFVSSGMAAPELFRHCGVIVTTNNMALFQPPDELALHGLAIRLQYRLARRLTIASFRRADAVVLHSRHALRTVSRFTGDIAAKTSVVLTGVPSATRLAAGAPPPPHPYGNRPYLLYLSAIRWYKNHLALIEAYRRLRERERDLPELLLGGICEEESCLQAIERAIRGAGLEERVRYLGTLPEEELPAWLHHAEINVFPSLTETNSVVLAEVLGMGGVLAASGIPPMTEVGGEAAVFFDPRDPADMSRVLGRLWRDPERRRKLRLRARERAGELSWDACGETIWRAASAVARRGEAA